VLAAVVELGTEVGLELVARLMTSGVEGVLTDDLDVIELVVTVLFFYLKYL
jgi:hypothetical protein